MITSVDTNVFEALWTGTPELQSASQSSLEWASQQGRLVIAPPVFAEIIAGPGRDLNTIETFLNLARIEIDWMLNQAVWRHAGLAFRDYARRRRKQPGDQGPRRILADFLIGAHAAHVAATLLTFDQHIYRVAFPTLTVVVPEN